MNRSSFFCPASRRRRRAGVSYTVCGPTGDRPDRALTEAAEKCHFQPSPVYAIEVAQKSRAMPPTTITRQLSRQVRPACHGAIWHSGPGLDGERRPRDGRRAPAHGGGGGMAGPRRSSSAAARGTTPATASWWPGIWTSAAMCRTCCSGPSRTSCKAMRKSIFRSSAGRLADRNLRPRARCRAAGGASGGATWIVDALLGTGAQGEPRPPLDAVIDQLNAAAVPILAIDLPSGLDCDTGEPAGHTIRGRDLHLRGPETRLPRSGRRAIHGPGACARHRAPRRLVEEVLAATG